MTITRIRTDQVYHLSAFPDPNKRILCQRDVTNDKAHHRCGHKKQSTTTNPEMPPAFICRQNAAIRIIEGPDAADPEELLLCAYCYDAVNAERLESRWPTVGQIRREGPYLAMGNGDHKTVAEMQSDDPQGREDDDGNTDSNR